ncbi:MAG: DUF4286 family protein [Bacteroidetes bacterium]|jgi:hypothetical protein|nr:DUF4286 family protein [Bacteroidota bacterium]
MYIYNITFNLEESIQHEWIAWMEKFFKRTISVGNFSAANIHLVMVKEEMGGVTYAVQFHTATQEKLSQFMQEELILLEDQLQQNFSGKYVFFHTELKVVSQFQP